MQPDHRLKCWPEYFCQIEKLIKPFEVRKGNDRTFLPGQIVHFEEWNPITKAYTGCVQIRRITYVLHGGLFLPPDLWVFGIELLK